VLKRKSAKIRRNSFKAMHFPENMNTSQNGQSSDTDSEPDLVVHQEDDEQPHDNDAKVPAEAVDTPVGRAVGKPSLNKRIKRASMTRLFPLSFTTLKPEQLQRAIAEQAARSSKQQAVTAQAAVTAAAARKRKPAPMRAPPRPPPRPYRTN
jgi:hypothetical protein